MTVGNIGFRGKKPAVQLNPVDPDKPRQPKPHERMTEKEVYEKMWTLPDYRKISPGELAAQTFFEVAKPKKGDELIDFGCGTGRGGMMMHFMGGLNVTMLDFASNALDDDLVTACEKFPDTIRFKEWDLNEPYPHLKKYGYCTDVMEHIPPDECDKVLENILLAAEFVFFRISTCQDVMGPMYVRRPLHLNVQGYSWWLRKLAEKEVIILYSEDNEGFCDFYVTGWSKGLPKNPQINTADDKVLSNIKENSKLKTKHVRPHLKNETEIQILCGGPSLNEFEEEVIQNHRDGMPTVTINGTYNWALERGITNVNQCIIDARPYNWALERGITNVNQCIIDARPFNKRFVTPPRDDCSYFIASQCDPSVFEDLPLDRTYMWQVTTSPDALIAIEDLYSEYTVCGGGSTCTLRAMVLMRMLGFYKQHYYGLDSCMMGDEHHAYPQEENDYKTDLMPVRVAGRTFQCHPFMAYQAHEFVDMVKILKDEIQIDVKGDGLIAWIIKKAAEMPPLEEGDVIPKDRAGWRHAPTIIPLEDR
jgi:hypothetical protein